MIVSTNTAIGIQCSKCGELQYRTLSAFAFSHFHKESFCCACGAPLLTMTNIEKGNFSIEYPCIYCGESHFMLAKRNLIWGEELLQLVCSEKELPVGYIGPRIKVVDSSQEIKKTFVKLASELVNDEGIDAEFDNFYVVYTVMEKLGKMVERRKLGCKCGNNSLVVEILPDYVELVCESCRSAGIIYTDNKEILNILDETGSIYLEENKRLFLNDSFINHNLVKNE